MRSLVSCAACALLLLAMLRGGVSRAEEDRRAAAGAHFARGVELAKQHRYEAALAEFNEANIISPHFAVLYNIGQALIALGRPAEATAALSKYLRDGADRVPAARRQEVEAQLVSLQSRSGQGAPPTAGAGATPPPATTTTPPPPAVPPSSASLTPRPTATPSPAMPAPSLSPPAAGSELAPAPAEAEGGRRHTWRRAAYVLVGVGALWGGAAVGVYLSNRDRYAEWRAANAALNKETPRTTAYYARANANNMLAASLDGANQAILGLSIVAGTLVAVGATLFVFDRGHARSKSEISFRWGPQSSANVTWTHRW